MSAGILPVQRSEPWSRTGGAPAERGHVAPRPAVEDVRPGARFREWGTPGRLLRVVRIVMPPSGIPHARLCDVGDPGRTVFVSCRALSDAGQYRPVLSRGDVESFAAVSRGVGGSAG